MLDKYYYFVTEKKIKNALYDALFVVSDYVSSNLLYH